MKAHAENNKKSLMWPPPVLPPESPLFERARIKRASLRALCPLGLSPEDEQLLAAYNEKDGETVLSAVAAGADPNLRMADWGEPLTAHSVEQGCPRVAELLLHAGASPLEDDAALLVALCCKGSASLLKEALSLCELPSDWRGGVDYMSLAEYAAACGQVDCLRVLRGCGMDLWADSNRALCEACRGNHAEVVRYLVEDCGAPLEQEYDDWSPLFYAVEHDALDCARILLEAGANPLHEDIGGATPFRWAASDNMLALLEAEKRKNRWLMPSPGRSK